MTSDWLCLVIFGALFVVAQSLPAGLPGDEKKSEQIIRPKGKIISSFLKRQRERINDMKLSKNRKEEKKKESRNI